MYTQANFETAKDYGEYVQWYKTGRTPSKPLTVRVAFNQIARWY